MDLSHLTAGRDGCEGEEDWERRKGEKSKWQMSKEQMKTRYCVRLCHVPFAHLPFTQWRHGSPNRLFEIPKKVCVAGYRESGGSLRTTGDSRRTTGDSRRTTGNSPRTTGGSPRTTGGSPRTTGGNRSTGGDACRTCVRDSPSHGNDPTPTRKDDSPLRTLRTLRTQRTQRERRGRGGKQSLKRKQGAFLNAKHTKNSKKDRTRKHRVTRRKGRGISPQRQRAHRGGGRKDEG
ncbi:hypothetical protein MNBD_PLANCTO03-1562 [hydrothermal vent metagenome]|uniref:Uncharacterized protein n=1 Tax=hydrothermal vent metagenome TaxID=652676 RepID=A0A3B1D716_9ZZZZ